MATAASALDRCTDTTAIYAYDEEHGNTAMTPFEHFLVTRFNVVDTGDTHLGLDDAWIASRIPLFEQVCLPSILGQSTDAFRWLILYDARTPRPFVAELSRHASSRIEFIPVEQGTGFRNAALASVQMRLAAATTHVITSRLDNDDALCATFMADVQAEFRGGTTEFLNPPIGFVWNEGRLYRRRYLSSPFLSAIEPRDTMRTVWQVAHGLAASVAPLRQYGDRPSWLQVIHDNNLLNVVRGRRRPLEDLTESGRFTVKLPRPARQESVVEVLLDGIVGFTNLRQRYRRFGLRPRGFRPDRPKG
jgi:hypothetical protein